MRGRDIKKYGYAISDLWLIYIPWHFPLHENPNISGASLHAEDTFQNEYPEIYNHLKKYKTQLSNRNKAETGIRYEWYALQRWGANYMDDFSKQKIIWGEISDKTKFCIDLDGKYVNEATTFLMTGSPLLFLLGYLNSKLSEYLFSKIGTTTGVGTVRWKKFTIEQLPVPKVDAENQKIMEDIIFKLLNRKNLSTEAESLQDEFNNHIYKHLEFSSNEIYFIENQ